MDGSYISKEDNEGYIGDEIELETRIAMQNSQVSVTINHQIIIELLRYLLTKGSQRINK